MQPGLNDPAGYYRTDRSPSLFWELTVCQSLAAVDSPSQAALRRPAPYGAILAEYLLEHLGAEPGWSVAEVGGGYGTLMAALLERLPFRHVTMVDISPFFSDQQRRRLSVHVGTRFVTADALEFLQGMPGPLDLVISNENIGDFPTVTGLETEALLQAARLGRAEGLLGEVAEVVSRYGLDLEGAPARLHFNLGAVRYLEALAPVAARVFLSEHGADTRLPPGYGFLPLERVSSYPQEVRLRGHSEYTIRFDHLERVARVLGYRVKRLHMAEFLGVRQDQGIRNLARQPLRVSERAEILHEFCAHVAEYQCMVLTRADAEPAALPGLG